MRYRRVEYAGVVCPITVASFLAVGCGMANPNTSGQSALEGTTRLTPITFSPASGFPQGADPAEFSIGDGSVNTSGGEAGTLGQPGLYADDRYAWDFFAGSTGSVTFTGLEVVSVDGYWVHPNSQSAAATMTVEFSGGGSVDVESAPVSAFGFFGQAPGFFESVNAPEGETISGLMFSFGDGADDGDVATLDVLELTIRNTE